VQEEEKRRKERRGESGPNQKKAHWKKKKRIETDEEEKEKGGFFVWGWGLDEKKAKSRASSVERGDLGGTSRLDPRHGQVGQENSSPREGPEVAD